MDWYSHLSCFSFSLTTGKQFPQVVWQWLHLTIEILHL